MFSEKLFDLNKLHDTPLLRLFTYLQSAPHEIHIQKWEQGKPQV